MRNLILKDDEVNVEEYIQNYLQFTKSLEGPYPSLLTTIDMSESEEVDQNEEVAASF